MNLIKMIFNNNSGYESNSLKYIAEDIVDGLEHYSLNSLHNLELGRIASLNSSIVFNVVIVIPIFMIIVSISTMCIGVMYNDLVLSELTVNYEFIAIMGSVVSFVVFYGIMNIIIMIIMLLLLSVMSVREYFISTIFINNLLYKSKNAHRKICDATLKAEKSRL